MYVDLYNVTSDRRRVNKPLENLITEYVDVTLDEDTSFINPTFILTGLNVTQKFNYLYCSKLNRYYFINDVEFCNGGIYKLHCHVDVLMTYYNDILSHSAFIERQESKSSKDFYDSSYPVQTKNTCYEIPIGVVGNSFGYYLTVNGGVQ